MAESTAESASTEAVSTVEEEASPETSAETTALRVAGLKGPTTMGLVNMLTADDASDLVDFNMYGAADEVVPLLVKGDIDAAAVPANLAATLYQKTNGAVEVACVNTLGVLYIVENGETVNSVADLKGQTLVTTGKGTTPEYVLRYVLSENGIDPDNDVTIEYCSEATEALSKVQAGEATIAMLPQPFVTSALSQVEGLRVALDMNEEWQKVVGPCYGRLPGQCGRRQHRSGRHRRPVRGVRHRCQGCPGPEGPAPVQYRVRDRRPDENRPDHLLSGPVRR